MSGLPGTLAPGDRPGVIVLPPLLYGGALVLGIALSWLWPAALPGAGWTWLRDGAGIALVLAGGALGFAAVRRFAASGTNVSPLKPATAFVAAGPFRWTRNPMYVGMTALYVGLALLLDSAWVLVLVLPVLAVMQVGVIRREERYLDAKFGDAYRAYCAQVRRWL